MDGAGNPTDYHYDPMGRLDWKQDVLGPKTFYTYWPSGQIKTITDRNNHMTTFNYDENDRLTERVDPRTNSDLFNYDGNGNLIEHQDRNKAVTTVAYDELNRPIQITGPTLPGDPTTIQEKYFYNGRGQVTKHVDKNGNATSYNYDDLGRLWHRTDPLQHTTTYGYDDAGNLTSLQDRRTNTWTYERDPLGRVSKVIDPYEKATSYEYSIFGSLESTTNALGETTTNEYDEAGRLVTRIDALQEPTSYSYYGNGQVKTVTDAAGRTTTYTYDHLGRLQTESSGSQPPMTFGYDNERNLTSITDPTGAVYQYLYNELDLPKSETNRLNVSQTYVYDAGGRLTTKTDFGKNPIIYKYDAQGNRTEVDYPDGTKKQFSYDPMGNLTAASNAAQAYTFDYDPLGRLKDAQNLDLGEEIDYSYDEEGNQTGLAWHNGKRTVAKSYGKANELKTVIDTENGETDFTYDDVLREISRRLPNGLVQVKGYDPAGRLTVSKTLNGSSDEIGQLSNEAYVYDASGKRTYTVDEKGRITAYKYDDSGRLAEVLYPFKSGKVASDFDERLSLGLFPQFESGVPTQTGNPKLSLGFTMPQVPGFDESGFEADLQGSLDGEDTIAKAYLGMTQQPGGDWKVTPGDGATPFTKQLAPTGTEPAMIQAAAIRANGRNTSIDINPYLWDETYSYDSRNNRTAKANGWGRIDYSYDAENRLSGAGKRTYSNDANGNLIEEALGTIKAEYEYDFENRAVDVYSQMAGFVGKGRGSAWTLQAGVRYEYDALGRRVTRTEYDTITRGQKRQREWNATTATDYLYDGLSMNVLAEAVDGNFRPDDLAVPYQPWNGDSARPGNGPSKPWPSSRSNYFAWSDRFHPMSEYVYGNNEILERVDFDTVHYSSAVKAGAQYYELDALGSVMMTTGPGGDVRDRYEYDAYGQAFEGSFRRINDLGYNGKRTDPTTGLIDYGFRDYAPKLGRFITSDPIQAGLNWYAYVNNDPMNATDPLGLDPGMLYPTGNSNATSPAITVVAGEPAVVVVFSGTKNGGGAATGIGYAFSSSQTASGSVHTTNASVSFPVVSGGFEKAQPTPDGTYYNVKTVPTSQSTSADLFAEPQYAGSTTYMPLGIINGEAAGDAVHQANNYATPNTAQTAGCAGVAGWPGTSTTAQTNYGMLQSQVQKQDATVVVISPQSSATSSGIWSDAGTSGINPQDSIKNK